MYNVSPDDAGIRAAAEAVRADRVVLYPTETVYGLGGRPTAAVVEAIQRLKGREPGKPMLVLTDTWERVAPWLADLTPAHRTLMAHEPSLPVTLLFAPTAAAPAAPRAGQPLLGIRCTSDPFCRALIAAADTPLLSTSANPSGTPTPSAFADVAPSIREGVALAVDGGTLAGAPSTVVSLQNGDLRVLREGAVSAATLQELLAAN